MKKIIRILFATLLLLMLPTTGTLAQPRRVKPPTAVKPTRPTPVKKPTRSRDQILSELIANMVYVEGGTFTMGATSEQGSDAYYWEKPVHQVTLSSFSICKYEVTQELWQAVMGRNPYLDEPKHPMDNVSWEKCQDFIRELNSLTGRRFRLPTEAEWEYAARGGNRSNGYKYSGSNSIEDVAWYHDNQRNDVGTKRANELGLYDMSGDVWEWCQDWYGSYSSDSQTNPTGPSSGSERVCRGGCWFDDARGCRVSYRSRRSPSEDLNYTYGLRLAF